MSVCLGYRIWIRYSLVWEVSDSMGLRWTAIITPSQSEILLTNTDFSVVHKVSCSFIQLMGDFEVNAFVKNAKVDMEIVC